MASMVYAGKIIKDLSALSGGEQALVAICIYFAILAVKPAAVLGLCYRSESREVLMLANCSQQAVEVLLPPLAEGYWSPILEDKLYQDGLHGGKDARLALSGYGYRWFSRSLS